MSIKYIKNTTQKNTAFSHSILAKTLTGILLAGSPIAFSAPGISNSIIVDNTSMDLLPDSIYKHIPTGNPDYSKPDYNPYFYKGAAITAKNGGSITGDKITLIGHASNAAKAKGWGSLITLTNSQLTVKYVQHSDQNVSPYSIENHILVASDGGTIVGNNITLTASGMSSLAGAYTEGDFTTLIRLTDSAINYNEPRAEQVRGILSSGGQFSINNTDIVVSGASPTNNGGAIDGHTIGSQVGNGGYAQILNSRVTVTGTEAYGLSVEGRSGTELTNTQVNVNGDQSIGMITNGFGSSSSITNSQFQLIGKNTIGINAQDASGININGGKLLSTGDNSLGIKVQGGSTLNANWNNLALMVNGLGSQGALSTGENSSIELTGTTITTDGGVNIGLNTQEGGSITAIETVIQTNADESIGVVSSGENSLVELSGQSTITSSGADSYGLKAANQGKIIAIDTIINTLGTANTAAKSSDENSLIQLKDVSISVKGAESSGLYADAKGKISAANTAISLDGRGSTGVLSSGENSLVELSAQSTITSSGENSYGLKAENQGKIIATDTIINTLGRSNFAARASDENSVIQLKDVSISVKGADSSGLYADAKGKISAANTAISLDGDNSTGVLSSGENSLVELSGQSTITSSGENSYGLMAENQGKIIATDTIINTLGGSNFAARASDENSVIQLKNVQIAMKDSFGAALHATAKGKISAANTTISLDADNSHGVVSSGENSLIELSAQSTITSSGKMNLVLYAVDQGKIIATDTIINILSNQTTAARAQGENSVIQLKNVSFNIKGALALHAFIKGKISAENITINLDGPNRAGGVVSDGENSLVELSGQSTITSSGADSYGLKAENQGKIIATDTIINILGTQTTAAKASDENSVIQLKNVSVSVKGNENLALHADAKGKISAANTTISLDGPNSTGALSLLESLVELSGQSTITSSGADSYGLKAENQGKIIAIDTIINTLGTNNTAVKASDENSVIQLKDVSISVKGADSIALHADAKGKISAEDADITTEGKNSHALGLKDASTIDINKGRINTIGTDSYGVYVHSSPLSLQTLNVKDSEFTTTGDLIHTDNSQLSASFENTRLTAKNNVLLSAQGDSKISLNVKNSQLFGDLKLNNSPNDSSQLQLDLQGNSQWTGAALQSDQAKIDVSLTDSKWHLNNDSNINELTLNKGSQLNFINDPFSKAFSYHTLRMNTLNGNGGVIALNASLGDDTSASDKIIVTDLVKGSTNLRINNIDGVGGKNIQGINVVNIKGARANNNAFTLAHTVVAGAYEYVLKHDANNNWYLSSSSKVIPPVVVPPAVVPPAVVPPAANPPIITQPNPILPETGNPIVVIPPVILPNQPTAGALYRPDAGASIGNQQGVISGLIPGIGGNTSSAIGIGSSGSMRSATRLNNMAHAGSSNDQLKSDAVWIFSTANNTKGGVAKEQLQYEVDSNTLQAGVTTRFDAGDGLVEAGIMLSHGKSRTKSNNTQTHSVASGSASGFSVGAYYLQC